MLKQQEAAIPALAYQSSFAPQEVPHEQVIQTTNMGGRVPETTAAPPLTIEVTDGAGTKKQRYSFPTVSRRRLRRVVRFVGPVLVLAILALALFIWNLHYGTVRFTVQAQKDKPFLLDLPWSAIVTALIASFGWYEYNRNYKLKQAQFAQDKAQAERRRIESEQAFAQKEAQFKEDQRQKQIQFDAKVQADRLQFEEKAQEDRFKDIQDRFASSDDKTRANAALRLAEMARLPHPDAKDKPICEANYPFFLRAGAALAIALHIEKDDSVRAANKEALSSMVSWAKQKEENDLMLRALIVKLYDANLIAKQRFVKILAEYRSRQEDDFDLSILSSIVSFTFGSISDMKTWKIISLMMEDEEFVSERRFYTSLHDASPKTSLKSESELLIQIKQAASCLITVRDSLANSLRALSPLVKGVEMDLHMEGVFLAAANLSGAHLKKVYFWGAQCAGASFQETHLENAVFFKACLEQSRFENAYLDNASFSAANLAGANFDAADLKNAKFFRADLSHASFYYGELQRAQFGAAILKETRISDVTLEEPNGSDKARFDSNWRQAHVDTGIIQWFLKNYGTNEEKFAVELDIAALAAASHPRSVE